MEIITEDLSRVHIDSKLVHPASRIFDEIVKCASNLRGHAIPAAEYAVTRQLASPFTSGGVLFLLQNPREDHPWDKGASSVISDCHTLDALAEGVGIGSEGALSMVDHITVLDLRPFISQQVKKTTLRPALDSLCSLVLKFIRAKRPNVLLCMGSEAGQKLKSWGHRLPRMKTIRTKHPSLTVNYSPRSPQPRRDLLQSVINAIGYSRNSHLLTIFDKQSAAAHDLDPKSSWVIHILRTVASLCFQRPIRHPQLNLLPGRCYYSLEPCQLRTLKYRQRSRSLLALISRLFVDLNSLITLNSWYLHRYTIDMDEVRRTIGGFVTALEALFDDNLLTDREQKMLGPSNGIWAKVQSVPSSLFDVNVLLSRLEPLVLPSSPKDPRMIH